MSGPGHRRPIAACSVAVSLLLAGCSSGSTNTPAVAVATGPPVVHLELAGGAGLTGALTPTIVHCALPTLEGPEILVIGTPADTSLSVRVMVRRGTVTAGVDTGSGLQYLERDFTGTGVPTFDPTRVAAVDSSLQAVVPATGSTVADLPALTSISGSVECAGQTPGTSTITLSGDTDDGAISGPISPVDVDCMSNPSQGPPIALIIGLVKVGDARALVDMSVAQGQFSLATETKAADRLRQYKAPAGSASITSSGVHIDGDAVETLTAQATTPHTIHVVGDAHCGRFPLG